MAIITSQQLRVLLPQTATISEPILQSAIVRAQSIVESQQGADRILEKQIFNQEHYQLNIPSQSFYVDHIPIDTNQPITLEARLGNVRNDRVTNTPIPIQQYQEVPADTYDLNPTTGEITIYSYINNPAYNSFGRSASANGLLFTEARLTYTGGYDFCATNDKAVERIQVYFASVLNYMLSTAGYYEGVGVKKKKVEKQYEIEYFDTASSSGANSFFNIPDSLLAPFTQYRPNLYDY